MEDPTAHGRAPRWTMVRSGHAHPPAPCPIVTDDAQHAPQRHPRLTPCFLLDPSLTPCLKYCLLSPAYSMRAPILPSALPRLGQCVRQQLGKRGKEGSGMLFVALRCTYTHVAYIRCIRCTHSLYAMQRTCGFVEQSQNSCQGMWGVYSIR